MTLPTSTILIPPRINQNGTSKQELVDGYSSVADALRAALDAMQRNSPNGRDYQTASHRDAIDAIDAYQMRMQILHDMIVEFDEIAYAIDQQ